MAGLSEFPSSKSHSRFEQYTNGLRLRDVPTQYRTDRYIVEKRTSITSNHDIENHMSEIDEVIQGTNERGR
jgi:hypothetical protein